MLMVDMQPSLFLNAKENNNFFTSKSSNPFFPKLHALSFIFRKHHILRQKDESLDSNKANHINN